MSSTGAESARQGSKDKYVLRFHSEDQRAELKARAALNRRTLNAELLYLIKRGMEAVDGA